MKLFEIDFKPVWPIGGCLVIKAETKEIAREIAKQTITHTKRFSVKEVSMKTEGVVVYLDGNSTY